MPTAVFFTPMRKWGLAPAHNPGVQFNEAVCPIGAACYAHCATEWLRNNR